MKTLAPKVSVALAIFAACCGAAITIANVNNKLKVLNWAIIPLFVIAGLALLYAIYTAFFRAPSDEGKPSEQVTLSQEIISLRNDLQHVMDEFGEEPDIDYSRCKTEKEQLAMRDAHFRYREKLHSRFERQFAPKIQTLIYKLGERNLSDAPLEFAMKEEEKRRGTIKEIIDRLGILARRAKS